MSDTLITVVAIMLAATLIFVVPLVTTSQRVDDVSQADVETLTSNFVDEIRATGKLTLNKYNKFLENLLSTGNTYDVNMEFKILDENPGKKGAQTTKDKIGENVYYSEYTTQIEEKLNNNEEETYNLKQGDMVYVTVKNTNLTLGQQMKDFAYKIRGNDTYTISASKSGLVTANGSTSVVLSDNDGNDANQDKLTYILRENDENGKILGINDWTNQNVYLEFSKNNAYNLDLSYFWRTARNIEDYINGYTQMESETNSLIFNDKTAIQAYWKSSALEKYSNIETININIDRIKPSIGTVTASNTGVIYVNGVTDIGGSGIYGYHCKWSEPSENLEAPSEDDVNWKPQSSDSFTIIAESEHIGKKCTVWVRDNAGNISQRKSAIVENIVSPVTSVTLENKILQKGNKTTIEAKIEGGTDYKSISYTSSDTSIAEIDSNDNIIGVAAGTSTITCTITNYDGTQVTGECILTVVDLNYSPNGGIFMYNSSKNANGQYYSVIKSTVEIQGATKAQYAWSTSNTDGPKDWADYNTANGGIVTKNESTTAKQDITYYLFSKVFDSSGNSTIYVSKSFKITADMIKIEPNITNWTNGDVICTITYPDSTIESTRKAAYGDTLPHAASATNAAIAPTTTVTVSQNGYIAAKARDSAGNEIIATMQITNIDKTAPKIHRKLNYNDNGIANKSQLDIVVQDNVSGLSKIIWYYKKPTESIYSSITDTYTTTNGTTIAVEKSRYLRDLTSGTLYNAYAEVYDVAGNSTRTSIIAFRTPTPVASIGSTYYSKLQYAIDAAETSSITMLENTSEEVVIDEGQTITVQLNGKTITGGFENNGTLTINGSGNVINTGSEAIYNKGELTLNSGTYTATDNYAINNTGTITFNNATIKNSSTTTGNYAALLSAGGTITGTGGTITSNNSHALGALAGSVNLTGVTLTNSSSSKQTVLMLQDGNITMEGCTVKNTTNGPAIANSTARWLYMTNVNITGTVNGRVSEIQTRMAGYSIYTYEPPSAAYLRYPTWTANNGQDDIKWYEATTKTTRNGNSSVYGYTINTANHNNESGPYNTHVYCVTSSGKQTFLYERNNITDIVIPK